LEERLGSLVGDVLIWSAFLSYMGPFLASYRQMVVYDIWIGQLKKFQIPASEEFELCNFMVNRTGTSRACQATASRRRTASS